MKKFTSLAFCLLFNIVLTYAQPLLLPSIGVSSQPDTGAAICNIPLYLGEFEDSGFQVGDTVPDFKLYNLDGEYFHLEEALNSGKPVLLVAGNYTCPVFRNKVPALNQLVDEFGSQVIIAVIYGLEAHPEIDISPYFGYVNTGSPNINAGILFRQPVTYGEREDVARIMLQEMDIHAPVYIDGPCNNWWSAYGPAPNNAYLIHPNGTVIAKHPWFNRAPDNMRCDIQQYLTGVNDCTTTGPTGTFTFHFVSDSIAYGSPGDALYVEAMLVNNSDYPVNIEVKRIIENVPANWSTSMCIDICYTTATDYTTIQIPAGKSQLFIMDFFTDTIQPGTGGVKIGFRNMDNLDNGFARRMYATTESTISTIAPSGSGIPVRIYPQPASESITIALPQNVLEGTASLQYRLLDPFGRTMQESRVFSDTFQIFREGLGAGCYVLQLVSNQGVIGFSWVIFID